MECLMNCSVSEKVKRNSYTDELNNICYLECPNPYLNTIIMGQKINAF